MTAKVNEVVAAYIKLRDYKTSVKDRHKEELAPTNENMDKIEAWLLRYFNDTGQTSAKTDNGTAYQTKVTTFRVEDWSAFSEWALANNMVDLFERKASKSSVEDYLESTGELPPGLSMATAINARIRR